MVGMGQRNRERRAAKQRARRREQSRARHRHPTGAGSRPDGFQWDWAAGDGSGWTRSESGLVMELAESELLSAATRHARGDTTAAARAAAELTRGRLGAQPR